MKNVKHASHLISIVLLLLQAFNAHSQNYKFEQISLEEGLPAANVNCYLKDTKGFIWFGTDNGLCRYDGYTFKNLKYNLNRNNQSYNFSIRCLAEDSFQRLWIGTIGGGIFCYDLILGKFIDLQINREISKNIGYIIFDSVKNLWLASENGLIKINNEQIISLKDSLRPVILYPENDRNKTLQTNIISTLYQHPSETQKYLWVGTNGGLFRLDLQNNQFKRIQSHPQNAVRQISEYKQNMLIVGSWDGGFILVDRNLCIKTTDRWIEQVNNYARKSRIISFLTDHLDRFWAVTYGDGIYVFEKSGEQNITVQNLKNGLKNKHFSCDFNNFIVEDKENILWIGTNYSGVSKLISNPQNLNYFQFLTSQNSDYVSNIQNITLDSDKRHLWVSTFGNGIFFMDTKTLTYKQLNSSVQSPVKLSGDYVNNIFVDKEGNLWFVISGKGLEFIPSDLIENILKKETGLRSNSININELIKDDGLINPYIMKIYQDTKSRLWFGTWTGLYLLSPKESLTNAKSYEEIKNKTEILTIFASKESIIKYFPHVSVISITEDSGNNIFIGTSNDRLIRITEKSPGNFGFQQYSPHENLFADKINCINEYSGKNIWLGTNSGIYRFDMIKTSFINYNENHGLTNDLVYGILQDKQSNLWFSTANGISFFNIENGTFKKFYINDNFILNQYNTGTAKTEDGNLIFSSSDAIVYFNPDSIKENKFIPPLYITDLRIDNQSISVGEEFQGEIILNKNIDQVEQIQVPYNHIISLEFAALDYVNPQRIQYKYLIKGSKSGWVTLHSNQRTITLSNQRKGTYTLRMKASNSDGIWNENEKVLVIKILPPFWQSVPAIVIYIIVLILLLLIYYKFSMFRIREKNLLEQERYERKKIEELNVLKTTFFTNISHEFRTPLTLILDPLENILSEGKAGNRLSEQIRIIYRNAKKLLRLIDELMDFSKSDKNTLQLFVQKGSIVKFIHEICSGFQNQAATNNIDFQIIAKIEETENWFDSNIIEKVLFNLLSNAFKFTPVNGKISVCIDIANNINTKNDGNDQYIKISVTDNGRGIPAEHLDHIFERFYQVEQKEFKAKTGTGIGLSMVKTYIELHKGRVEVESEENNRTIFTVYFPANKDHYSLNEIYEQPVEYNIDNETFISNSEQSEDALLKKEKSSEIILIVEDNFDVRSYLKNELGKFFLIEEASNGKEGIEKARELLPDLIISDVIMPEIDGIELCKTLKTNISTSHIPIILLTAKAAIENKIEGIETGADIYITKPFNIRYLHAQAQRLLEFRQTLYKKFLVDIQYIPKESVKNSLDQEFLDKIVKFIEINMVEPDLSVEQLASEFTLSRTHVYRKIKALTGQAPVEFIRAIKLKKAARLILENQLNITEIAFQTGFSTPSYFTKCFRSQFGKTPTEYANDNRNQ